MSQHDLTIANQGYAAFRADLNGALAALGSTSKGSSRPSGALAGQLWLDDDTPTATLWTLKLFDGSDDIDLAYVDTAANVFYPFPVTKAIHGLTLANNSGDAANDIDVAPGLARAESNDDALLLTQTLVKRLDAAWAVGTNAGGLDTGAETASTLYAVWLIKRPDTGVVDALFSTSFTAPTMPTNYTRKRLIGAVYNDASSSILSFVQQGDYFRYTGALFVDVDDNTITADTYEVGTLSVPPNALAHLYARMLNASETATIGRVHVKRNGAGETGTSPSHAVASVQSSGTFDDVTAMAHVMTDANRQIQYAASESGGTARVVLTVAGFEMLTRSHP